MRPPTQFGNYPVLGVLGEGGMGTVYLSRHPRLGFEVAIKTLLRGSLRPERHERFRREIQALSRLEHPGLVEVFDTGEEEGTHWYAMRRVAGGTLEDRLRTGPLEPWDCVELGLQLSEAVQHAHEHRVLHRDLKPDNVLVGPNRRYVVTDFGLTKDLDATASQRLSKSGAIQGTPGFWAPEQAAGRGHEASPATDVYGIGAVVYAALTARAPISGDSLIEVMIATQDHAPVPPSRLAADLPPGLEDLVLRCLAKEPAERPTLPALIEELRDLGRSRPDAKPPSARGPRYAVAALAACLGGALLTAALLARSSGSLPPTPSSPALADAEPLGSGTATPSPREAVQPTQWDPSLGGRGSEEAHALFLQGQAAYSGEGAPLDRPRALRLWREAAALGSGRAMTQLGSVYSRGLGVPPDRTAAREWYQRAAEAGAPEGMANLGSVYHYGLGVPVDLAQALYWHRKAADLGHANSMAYLGSLYLQGVGVERDHAQGARWMQRAAEGGDPSGMALLSRLYYGGTGVPQSLEQAMLWLQRAAEAGDAPARSVLARRLLIGEGIPQDLEAGARWARLACEAGDLDGIAVYGHCLMTGQGVERDPVAAVKLFEAAASKGHTRGMLLLGESLAEGAGVQQDFPRAQRLFRQVAERGDPRAMYYLGRMARDGLVGEPDLAAAARWFKKAADLGEPDATHYLGLAYRDGVGVAQDRARALSCLSRAASKGVARAHHYVGVIHYDGGDLRRALESFRENSLVHSGLYAFLCVLELEGRPAAETELRTLVRAHPRRSEWAQEMIGFLLLESTEAAFLAAAAKVKDEKERRARTCEATFLAGVLRLRAGDTAGARRLLEACLATERRTYRQYWSAKAILDRLGG